MDTPLALILMIFFSGRDFLERSQALEGLVRFEGLLLAAARIFSAVPRSDVAMGGRSDSSEIGVEFISDNLTPPFASILRQFGFLLVLIFLNTILGRLTYPA